MPRSLFDLTAGGFQVSFHKENIFPLLGHFLQSFDWILSSFSDRSEELMAARPQIHYL